MSITGVQRITWAEIAFWCLLALHLVPILAFHWFPTLDGPCHVYNARLIHDLLAGSGDVGRFFKFNPFPEPNWLGHAIMAAVMFVAPANIAEKVLLVLFAAGLPLAFRWCARSCGGDRWMVLLAFPFIYCYPMRMGFFNFCLGLPLMLLLVKLWRRHLEGRLKGAWWKVTLLLIALWFTHLVVLLITLLLMAAFTFFNSPPAGMRRGVKQLLLFATPVLVLVCWYFLHHHGSAEAGKRIAVPELLRWVAMGRPFITLSFDEWPFAAAIGGSIALAAMAVAFIPGLSIGGSKVDRRIWWGAAIGSLVLAFILPDAMASGKILTPRLLLFAWLFAALGIASIELHRWLRIPVLIVVITADLFALRQQYAYTADLEADVDEYTSIASGLRPGDVLLPLNYSDHWLHSNFICYAGAATGAIVLDNFVAITPTSPLIWRKEAEPYEAIGDFASSHTPCARLAGYERATGIALDRVSTWSMPANLIDSCSVDLRSQLTAAADTILVSPKGRAILYDMR